MSGETITLEGGMDCGPKTETHKGRGRDAAAPFIFMLQIPPCVLY